MLCSSCLTTFMTCSGFYCLIFFFRLGQLLWFLSCPAFVTEFMLCSSCLTTFMTCSGFYCLIFFFSILLLCLLFGLLSFPVFVFILRFWSILVIFRLVCIHFCFLYFLRFWVIGSVIHGFLQPILEIIRSRIFIYVFLK